jgi:uncharacterized protein YndB with AHSA1/START domain
MTATEIAPLVKEVFVAAPVERAWSAFTRGIGDWWPVATHSIEPERVAEIAFEGRVGGRIVERWDDGTEWSWGEVDLWEPPHRLRFSWHPSRAPAAATEVEVTFASEGSGTRVTLEHRKWELLGAAAAAMRSQYDRGWDFVLGRYAEGV